MKKYYIKSILCSVLLYLGLSTLSIHAETKYMTLHVGSIKTLEVGSVERVAVGRDDILATSILDNGQMLLIPRAPGETDLKVWKEGERQLNYRINILASNIGATKSIFKSLLSGFPEVNVRSVDGFILLEGYVAEEDKEVFDAVSGAFNNVISTVRVKPLTVKDNIKISARVLEIDKRFEKDLGFNWDTEIAGPAVGIAGGFLRNGAGPILPSNGGSDFSYLNGGYVFDPFINPYAGIASSITSRIQLMEENGGARTLSKPILISRSGSQAEFQSGGEIPIQVIGPLGQPSIEFLDYGVILGVIPTSDRHGNIRLQLDTEVSALDFSVSANGVPGKTTRNTQTDVNIRSGQTIAISGLLSTFDSLTKNKVPGLGDVPIVGNLFKSSETLKQRNELLILVTAEILPYAQEDAFEGKFGEHYDQMNEVLDTWFDEELME